MADAVGTNTLHTQTVPLKTSPRTSVILSASAVSPGAFMTTPSDDQSLVPDTLHSNHGDNASALTEKAGDTSEPGPSAPVAPSLPVSPLPRVNL